MTRNEFAQIMAYVALGCGKSLAPDAAEVYYQLLGQLPADVLHAAAIETLRASTFPVFPQIGTLWQTANALMRERLVKQSDEWYKQPDATGPLADARARKCLSELSARWKTRAIESKLGPWKPD